MHAVRTSDPANTTRRNNGAPMPGQRRVALKHHRTNASCQLRTRQTQNMCTAPIQRWPNVGAVQRLRRWSNTAQTLHKCPTIAGKTCEIK